VTLVFDQFFLSLLHIECKVHITK